MEPILIINQIRGNDENAMNYRITITQGADVITTDEELLSNLKDSIPYKRGIIEITRVSNNIWEIKTSK